MKKLSLLFAAVSMVLLMACAPLKVDQLPSRTPTDFLLDIKAVADVNDFTDIDAVGKRLRIDLVAGPEEPRYDNDGSTLLGYGMPVEERGMAREYASDNFSYGIFRPKDRSFDRALVSVTVNSEVICVTEIDLKNIFKKLRKSISPHLFLPSYSYDGVVDGDWTYFSFTREGCLRNFRFFKNNRKE